MMMDFIKNVYIGVDWFFALYLVGYSTFLLLSVTVGSVTLYEQRKKHRLYNYIDHDYYVPITIIVPAYNEQTTVIDTVHSLLELDYRLYEIIVVDDGSTDDTAQRLVEHFNLTQTNRPIRKKIPCKTEQGIYESYSYKVPITLITKENAGKSDALNMGINASQYPYFICMDADSVLQSDALKNIIRPVLEQDHVVACGGLVRIINDVTLDQGRLVAYRLPKKLVVCMQVLEYDRAFLASRLFFDKFNGNLIISGAFGLFKKDLVISVGGYDNDTIGEDMELVIRLHAFCRANHIPYKIKYASNSVCWSQAPQTLKDLKKQRRRWHIGLFQSINTHKQILFNPQYGMLSFISFVYFLIYELLSPYIEIFGIATILIAWYFNLINVPYMLLFFGIYAVFCGIMSLTASFSRVHAMSIKLRFGDIIKTISFCLIENIGLRMILAFTRLTAFVGYKKNRLSWDKVERFKMKNGKNEVEP